VVDAVGPEVTLFKPGDGVFYAGSIQRQGTNSEFHLVDERIVGKKPKTLSFAQAAALPLTSITAWELLFDRLGAVPGKSVDPRTLLITGGAGGVGSILIQLARRLTGLTVLATATRPQSQQWCLELGAHAVIDHAKPMKEQIEKLKVPPVALVASLTFTDQHYKAIADFMAPQGKFGLIDDPPEFTVSVFKGKAISIHWESMFTRSSFQTPDMIGSFERRRRPYRQGRAAHYARPDLWHHQRRQSKARPRAIGIRQIARQDRAGGVVAVKKK
jgi:zinc-binding alcohol dehydrogenase family protein